MIQPVHFTAPPTGSEGKGLRPLVQQQCTGTLTIGKATTCVDSLNVSVAAAILIHSLTLSAAANRQ